MLVISLRQSHINRHQYPKTTLPGSKWKAFDSQPAFGSAIYEYLSISTTGTSATVTFADVNGNNGSSVTGTCAITLDPMGRNIDSFILTYASGKTSSGFTTSNANQINFDGRTYDKQE